MFLPHIYHTKKGLLLQPFLGFLIFICDYCFSQGWLATPQDVLQADWQDVWHSPQPPFCTDLFRSRVAIVLILLISFTSPKSLWFLLNNKFFPIIAQ